MNRSMTAVAAVALLGASQGALATDVLSNSYVDAAYLNAHAEAGSQSELAEGFRLAANVGLAKFLNFSGDYDQLRFDGSRLRAGSAGFAWHTQDPVWQFHVGVSYERVEADSNGNPAADDTEDGYGAELGLRYMFPNVEVHAGYRYMDFGEIVSGVDFTGARYGAGFDLQLSPWWSLVADYKVREHTFEAGGSSDTTDFNEYSVGFRHYFATDSDLRNRHGGLLTGMGGDEGGESQ